MRLKCPNCGAQYEVDSAMVPDPGRDVLCAACGHGWFQEAEGAAGDGAVMLDTLKSETAKAVEPKSTEKPSPAVAKSPQPEVAEDSDLEDGDVVPPSDTLLTPDRRSLDPGVRKVLEEEAARERKARSAEAQPMSTQPDLGLDDLDESDFSRSAKVTPEDTSPTLDDEDDAIPGAVAALAAPAATQGDKLPDVEEINSSLRSTAERDPKAEAAVVTQDDRKRKRGFRLGFSIVLIATTLAILAYLYAPQLAQQYPQARDPLARYVDNVNKLRDRVDGWMDLGVEKLQNLR